MFGETSNQTISSRRPTVKMLLKCILTTALLFQKKVLTTTTIYQVHIMYIVSCMTTSAHISE